MRTACSTKIACVDLRDVTIVTAPLKEAVLLCMVGGYHKYKSVIPMMVTHSLPNTRAVTGTIICAWPPVRHHQHRQSAKGSRLRHQYGQFIWHWWSISAAVLSKNEGTYVSEVPKLYRHNLKITRRMHSIVGRA